MRDFIAPLPARRHAAGQMLEFLLSGPVPNLDELPVLGILLIGVADRQRQLESGFGLF